MPENNPFSSIFIDKEKAIDNEVLISYVKPYLQIITGTGEIVLTKEFTPLSDEAKLVVILLSRKIMRIIGMNPSEGLGPTELSKITGVGLSSAKKIVLSSKYLSQETKGKYIVPNYALTTLNEVIKNETSHDN